MIDHVGHDIEDLSLDDVVVELAPALQVQGRELEAADHADLVAVPDG